MSALPARELLWGFEGEVRADALVAASADALVAAAVTLQSRSTLICLLPHFRAGKHPLPPGVWDHREEPRHGRILRGDEHV